VLHIARITTGRVRPRCIGSHEAPYPRAIYLLQAEETKTLKNKSAPAPLCP